jgi:hypothetical protein
MSTVDQRLDALIAKVQSGEITQEQARAETTKIALGIAMNTGSPVAEPDNTPATQLATSGLQRLQGLTKTQAERLVLLDGVEAYSSIVASERMHRAERARAALEAQLAQSPAERLKLAEAIEEQFAAEAALVEKAKLLLVADGMNPAQIEELAADPNEWAGLIEASGLSQQAYEAARAAEAAENDLSQLPASGRDVRAILTGDKSLFFPEGETTLAGEV